MIQGLRRDEVSESGPGRFFRPQDTYCHRSNAFSNRFSYLYTRWKKKMALHITRRSSGP